MPPARPREERDTLPEHALASSYATLYDAASRELMSSTSTPRKNAGARGIPLRLRLQSGSANDGQRRLNLRREWCPKAPCRFSITNDDKFEQLAHTPHRRPTLLAFPTVMRNAPEALALKGLARRGDVPAWQIMDRSTRTRRAQDRACAHFPGLPCLYPLPAAGPGRRGPQPSGLLFVKGERDGGISRWQKWSKSGL